VDVTPPFSDSGKDIIPDRWWTVFRDVQLNQFISGALKSNLDLKTAWQRLREAWALLKRESSSLWPEINATLEGESRKSPSDPATEEAFPLSLSTEYEVDLWGRLRSAADARRFEARASFHDYRTAALSLSAEITRTWFRLGEAQQQMTVIEEQIQTNQKIFSLLKNRLGSGLIRAADTLRQKQLIESTREQKISAESRIHILRHQLAVLLGLPPQRGRKFSANVLPDLPPLPETGIPADLINRRPDVQAAFNRLRAADRELASAISSRFPRFSVSASLDKTAESAENIFKDWIRTLAANLLVPIFQGGRLKAEVNRSRAVKEQRLSSYGQTILTALREVEDALVLERKQRERIGSIELQLKLANQTLSQLRTEYFNGLVNYLDVLTSLDDEQQLRRDLLTARLNLLDYRISLYRALAGGWKTFREKEKP
jgi:multidrug efflux system outer membrane protein